MVSFNAYIYKVLKDVHPDLGMLKSSRTQLDALLKALASRISASAIKLTHESGTRTVSSRDVQTVVRMLFQSACLVTVIVPSVFQTAAATVIFSVAVALLVTAAIASV